jgi:hypothetical protein
MITVVLIFSLLILLLASVAVFRRRLFLYPKSENENLPPAPRAVSLFAPTDEEMRDFEKQEREKLLAEKRKSLRQNLTLRANEEDFTVLNEAAETEDFELYQNLLDLLVEKIKLDPKKVENLAAFIVQNKLRANEKLFESFLVHWEKEPSVNSLSKFLQIAAASSAEIYLQAVKTAVSLYQAGKLKPMTADELITVLESQYWLLAQDARISGAGFLLKTELASVRREITESSRESNS